MVDPSSSTTGTVVNHHETVDPSLAHILKGYPGDPSQRPPRLSQEQVSRISELLAKAGKTLWSRIPRIYAVLHMIDEVEKIEAFLQEQISDLWFPFSIRTLPGGLRSSADQYAFIELQDFVLTKALDLEREDGNHRHFANSNELPFHKQEELGKGGFGSVDRVLSTISYKEYARKLIPRGKTFRKNAEALRNYERELGNLKKLRHEHIVQFIGSYTDPKYVGILMTPVADMNLKDFLTHDTLSTAQRSILRTFFGCLAVAVQYLHENQVRHKDIKPKNILVKDHHVYLTDFGLSLDWSTHGQSTTTGYDTGKTERYCAPEVATHLRRNTLADLWSLGCVFLEMWSVLKGESLENLANHLASFGRGSTCYHRNPDAIISWCNELAARKSAVDENRPLAWISGILVYEQDQRWNANTLVTELMDANETRDNSLLFVGNCCSYLDDDSTASNPSTKRDSRMIEDTGVSRIEVYEPDLNARKQSSQRDDFVNHLPTPTDSVQPQPLTPQDLKIRDDRVGPASSASALSVSSATVSEESVGSSTEKAGPAPPVTHTTLSQALIPNQTNIESSRQNTPVINDSLLATKVGESICLSDKPIKIASPQVRTAAEPCTPMTEGSIHLDMVKSPQHDSCKFSSGQVSPNGRFVVVCLGGKMVILWDIAARESRCLHTLDSSEVSDILFSPDSSIVIVSLTNREKQAWSFCAATQGTMSFQLSGLCRHCPGIVFSPDRLLIVSCSGKGEISSWDVSTGRRSQSFLDYLDHVDKIEFSRDSKIAALCFDDQRRMCLWQPATRLQVYVVTDPAYRYTMKGITFSPDNSVVASFSHDKLVRLWSTITGQVHHVLSGHSGHVYAIVFSPKGNIVASCSHDNSVRLWDVGTGHTLHILSGQPNFVKGVKFSPDNWFILSYSFTRIRIWLVETGHNFDLLPDPDDDKVAIRAVTFSEDSKLVLAYDEVSGNKSWDILRSQKIDSLDRYIRSIATSQSRQQAEGTDSQDTEDQTSMHARQQAEGTDSQDTEDQTSMHARQQAGEQIDLRSQPQATAKTHSRTKTWFQKVLKLDLK